jgi:hypothetical protein
MRWLALWGTLATGCTVTVGHVASITPLHPPAPDRPATGRRVVGQDCVALVIVGAVRQPHLDHATEEALRDGGRVLTDVVIRYRVRYVPFIGGDGCYLVEATSS